MTGLFSNQIRYNIFKYGITILSPCKHCTRAGPTNFSLLGVKNFGCKAFNVRYKIDVFHPVVVGCDQFSSQSLCQLIFCSNKKNLNISQNAFVPPVLLIKHFSMILRHLLYVYALK